MKIVSDIFGFLRNVLFIFAILAIVCTIMCLALKLQPIVVRSGSMVPTIGVGSVGIIDKKDTSANVGDIVAFKIEKIGVVTHRIYDIKEEDGKNIIYTKGDANDAPDTWTITEDDIIGHVPVIQRGSEEKYTIFPIPNIGYAIGVINGSKTMMIIFITFCLMILVIAHYAEKEVDRSEKIKKFKKRAKHY